jgi:sensor domain CHASE-containing protein
MKTEIVLRKGNRELRWVRPQFVTTRRGKTYQPAVLAVFKNDKLDTTLKPVRGMERARFGKRLIERNEKTIKRVFKLSELPTLRLGKAVRLK